MELAFKEHGKYIAFLRRHPTHAARVIFGIIMPPHESAMLETSWLGYRDYTFKCFKDVYNWFVVCAFKGFII
jgi:hypothetical protein